MRISRIGHLVCLQLATAVLCVSGPSAGAATHHHRHHSIRDTSGDAATDATSPGRYADFVVDAKTGRILHATNPDALRHPASLTKMMTLYVLFEELERGRFKMDSMLTVSAHAASQSPTKLNLRPGQQISVNDAIHGLVTQSANDAAVTIAENVGGSEEAFARRMTQTAHRIGMSNTTFYNASGLPNAEQYTTARDMVTLGRALQERFPDQYKVFSTRSFAYRGRVYGNHNHLLGRIEGVDGIKTGYTEASGFNLVTSIHRDGRFVVAAVMGGSSGGARDAQMIRLLQTHLAEASVGPYQASIFTDVRMAARDGEEKPTTPIPVAINRTEPPATPPTLTRNRSAEAMAVASLPQVDPAEVRQTRPHHEEKAHAADHPSQKPDDRIAAEIMARAIEDDQKHRQVVASLDNFIPSVPAVRPTPGDASAPKADQKPDAEMKPQTTRRDRQATNRENELKERLMTAAIDPQRPTEKPSAGDAAKPKAGTNSASGHETWSIQLAAVDNQADAKAMLSKARSISGGRLASEKAVAERFSKGSSTLYRVRFAGFTDVKAATAACSSLKQKDFACLVIHQ